MYIDNTYLIGIISQSNLICDVFRAMYFQNQHIEEIDVVCYLYNQKRYRGIVR